MEDDKTLCIPLQYFCPTTQKDMNEYMHTFYDQGENGKIGMLCCFYTVDYVKAGLSELKIL